MSRERTRYEVHTLKGDHWVLNGVHESEAAARRTSAALLAAGRIEATRIVRDWLRPDGRHVETEIACDRRPPARTLTVVAIDEPPEVCAGAQDFYGQGARMAMGRLLRRYAEHAVVTPTEILHNHGEMKRLSDTGTLVAGAVGRVAVLQAEKTGIAGAERRDALYRAVDDLDRRARWAAGLTDLPQVDLVGLAAAMDGIHAIAPEEEWDFLARVALCRDLVARRNWLAKFDWLHDLMLAGGGLPDRPMALADGVLADVAGAPGLAGELLGPFASPADLLADLIDLSRGRLDAGERHGDDRALRLNELLAFHDLPETRQQLLDLVRRHLRSTNPLTHGGEPQERAAFRRLLARLVGRDGVAGGPAMADALVRRALRFQEAGGATGLRAAIGMTVEALPDAVRAVRFLLALAASDAGRSQAETVDARLDALTQGRGALERLIAAEAPVPDNLATLTALHAAVLAAALPEPRRRALADAIDERLVEYIDTRRVVERLDPADEPLRVRADRLVGLCAPGILQSGKALGVIRQRVIGHLRQPEFERRYTDGIPDPAAREQALRQFHELLAKAGFR